MVLPERTELMERKALQVTTVPTEPRVLPETTAPTVRKV